MSTFWKAFNSLPVRYIRKSPLGRRTKGRRFSFADRTVGSNRINAYSWDINTLNDSGISIPVIYGSMKTGGNVIASHILYNQYTNSGIRKYTKYGAYLNSLVALCSGPIDSISDVKLNGQTWSNYPEVAVQYRYGYINQPICSNFNDTTTIVSGYSFPITVEYDVAQTVETNATAFDQCYVVLSFPNGIYKTSSGGDIIGSAVKVTVEYKKTTDSIWTKILDNDWIRDAKNKQLYYTVTAFYATGADEYEVKITKSRSNDVDPDIEMHIESVNLVNTDDFQYPGIAMMSVKAFATEKLNGSFDFSCIVKGKKVWVYNGATWTYQWSENPAWIAYDILTQPIVSNTYIGTASTDTYTYTNLSTTDRYDGLSTTQIDLASFYAWATHCDTAVTPPSYDPTLTKRCTFNGIFDSQTNLWDAALEVADVGRASLVIENGVVRAVIDGIRTISQLFTSGNIISGSLKTTYLSKKERISELEVSFANYENDYETETLAIYNSDATWTKSDSMDLFGTVHPHEAWRRAMLELYYNYYVNSEVEFSTGLDYLSCQVGDLIGIQHELPQWGYGGRIVSASASQLELDRPVVMSDDNTYNIYVRNNDDTLTKHAVDYFATAATGSYILGGTFSPVPSQYDIYAFGEEDIEVAQYVVKEIKPGNNIATIKGIEYNSSIFSAVDDGTPAVPTPNYSSLNSFPEVTITNLDEILIKNQDGSIIDCLDVYFNLPTDSSMYDRAKIYYNFKAVGDEYLDSWIYAGETADNRFRIKDVLVGYVYKVAVVTVNIVGLEQDIDQAPYSEMSSATLGKYDPPSNVTGFDAYQNLNIITFSWTHIEDADLWGYEIREGTTYDTSTEIIDVQSANRYDYPIPLNGTYRFWIKAIDTSGNYSTTPASIDITVTGVDDMLNFIYDHELISEGNMAGPYGGGTLFHYTWVSGTPALHWDVNSIIIDENGDCEADIMTVSGSSSSSANCTFAQSSTYTHNGNFSALMTATAASPWRNTGDDFTLDIDDYTISVWVYMPTASTGSGVSLSSRDISGELDSDSTNLREQWVKLEIATTFTDSTRSIRFAGLGGAADDLYYFDDFRVRKTVNEGIPSWLSNYSEFQNTMATGNSDYIAYYQTDPIQIADMSLSSTIRLQEITDVEAENVTDLTFSIRTDQTYPNDTDQHITTVTPSYLYYAIGATPTAATGFVRYTGPIKETFSYIAVREVVVADNYNTDVELTSLRIAVDMDDIDFDITGYEITNATGANIYYSTYGYDLYITPIIQATTSFKTGLSSTANVSLIPAVSEIDSDKFHIKLIDIAGQGRTGYVNINVHGY